MNTYSRRRRTFLSLLLSVAMVLSYTTAFLGTSTEDVYADTSVITFDIYNMDDDGALHFKLEEGYTQDDSWLGISYVANTDMDPVKNYVKFELLGSSGFTLNTNTGFSMVTGDYQSVSFVPDEGLEVGTYNLTLNVYEDASGTGSFEGNPPAATYSIVVDVVPYEPFDIDPSFWQESVYMSATEGYDPEIIKNQIGEIDVTNNDENFTGQSISSHIKFEFTGANADSFSVAGIDDITFGSPEDGMTNASIYIKPKQGLTVDEYRAELNVYVDNTGNQSFETPVASIPVEFSVSEQQGFDYEVSVDNYGSFDNLTSGYTSEDIKPATVTVKNTGKKSITVNPALIRVTVPDTSMGAEPSDPVESKDFTVAPLISEPVTIGTGETYNVATIAPATGLSAGQHQAALDITINCEGEYPQESTSTVQVVVVGEGALLELQEDTIDFGTVPPGLSETDTIRSASVLNCGNVSMAVTGVESPAQGPFKEMEFSVSEYEGATHYNDCIYSGSTQYLQVYLDPASEYASQEGTYEGVYKITYQQVNEDNEIVDGGEKLTVNIPVRVKVADERPDYSCTINDDQPLDLGYLVEGYTEDNANARSLPIVVTNNGKKSVDIDPTGFKLFYNSPNYDELGEAKEVKVILDQGTEPITIPSGEQRQIVSIAPATDVKPGMYYMRVFGNYGPTDESVIQEVSLKIVKEGAHLECDEPEDFDFGTELVGLPNLEAWDLQKDAYIRNTGDTTLKICEIRLPEEGPFATCEVPEDGGDVLAPGDVASLTLGLAPEKATEPGDYDTHYTVVAKPVDENGELIDDAEALELEIPVHVSITDESYKLTFDFQGHADNVEIIVPKGGKRAYDYEKKAQLKAFDDWEPVDDGCILKGFNLHPLDKYSDWESYDTDRDEYWETEVTGDMTVYAMWHPIIDTPIELEVPPCLCGQPALVDSITAKAGEENIEASLQWYTADEMTEEDTVIDAENNYQAYLYVSPRAKFPYVLTWDAVDKAGVKVNGELMHPNIDERDALVISYPVTAQHDIEKLEAADATCAKDGNIECWTCKGCGKYFSDENASEELDAANVIKPKLDNHTLTKVDKVDATCAKEGTEAYWKCSVCEKMFSDAEGTKEIEAPVAIPKTDKHSWGEWKTTKEATTSAAGEEARTCSVCKKTETRAIPKKQETKYSNGWHKIGGEWYYYKNNAKVTNGWAKDSKGWCFLDNTGKMVRNGWVKDSKGYCWLNSSGYWVTGTKWIKCNGDWYYITNGYRDANKWKKDSKGWCYLGKDGKMITNGWAKDSHGWCWMGSNGYWTSNKWVKDNGEWYYIKRNHYMASNEWAKDSGGWMYMAKNGKITKSKWIKSGGAWYYLKDNGYMATGTLKIGSKTYRFASSGKWID